MTTVPNIQSTSLAMYIIVSPYLYYAYTGGDPAQWACKSALFHFCTGRLSRVLGFASTVSSRCVTWMYRDRLSCKRLNMLMTLKTVAFRGVFIDAHFSLSRTSSRTNLQALTRSIVGWKKKRRGSGVIPGDPPRTLSLIRHFRYHSL
jgi:hypothetical protein